MKSLQSNAVRFIVLFFPCDRVGPDAGGLGEEPGQWRGLLRLGI